MASGTELQKENTKPENKYVLDAIQTLDNVKSFAHFTKWLHRPVDAASLGVFRMFFGLAMLVDVIEERGGSQLDVKFGNPKTCHFPLFPFIQHMSLPYMGAIYLIMWLGALGIALGAQFKLSCVAFIVPYWYVFLIEKPAWNNHTYLFGLCGILLLTTQANRYCSLDIYNGEVTEGHVPYWNYFLIKFQFFVMYTYAGMKKFSFEWLSGYAMTHLAHHWLFTPFRLVLSEDMIDLLIVHWFTAIFDFCIPFLMTYHRTRRHATTFMICFHLMNSRLFVIGMFPWVCLAEVPLFFAFDWPRKFQERVCTYLDEKEEEQMTPSDKSGANTESNEERLRNLQCNAVPNNPVERNPPDEPTDVTPDQKYRVGVILLYCGLQLFLPYSHFITKGCNNWTNGLYGYSWDMMVHSYDTVMTTIKIVDNSNGGIRYLEPFAFTQYDRWIKSADMAVQYAHCINRNIMDEMEKKSPKSPASRNISIYFDVWCSMNGRFHQRIYDPNIDMLKAHWSPFEPTTWLLPLLNELNYLRPLLKTQTEDIFSWNNYTDVIFIADFPGLTLENFISPDLDNITLTVIEGTITFKNLSYRASLEAGQSLSPIKHGAHLIKTDGLTPSCYSYTYINKTMYDLKMVVVNNNLKIQEKLPLWSEFKDRIKNAGRFLYNVFNSVMFLLYRVPIPIEIQGI